MNREEQGILYYKGAEEQKTEKFKVREFVITQEETVGTRTFTNYLKFQLNNDKCKMIEEFKVGEKLNVSFNLRGNKYESGGKTSYFNQLEAWKINRMFHDKV